ncbi:MAG: hypothetical protein U0229_16640 [Anaeromyxobacter sp.]
MSAPARSPFEGGRSPHPLDLAWLRLGRDWAWLAIVPAEPGLDVSLLARALARVGEEVSQEQVEFRDASRVEPGGVPGLVTDLRREKRGGRAVVALSCPLSSAAALEVARSADGVVLCTRRGQTPLAGVRAAAAAIGKAKLVCSLLIDEGPPAPMRRR